MVARIEPPRSHADCRDAANAREQATGGYQGVSTEPRDIAAEQVAQMLRERGKQV